jgi:hypothetical protein
MRVHRYVLPFVLIAALLGSVQISKAVGYWSTSRKAIVLTDASGRADPAGIAGWMTLAQICEIYGVPPADLWVFLGLPVDTPSSELDESVAEFGTGAVREFVAAYRAANPDAAPPVSQIEIPDGRGGKGQATSERSANEPTSSIPLSTEAIRGRHSLAEVAQMFDIPLERLIAEAGLPANVDTKVPLQEIELRYQVGAEDIREVADRILASR